MTYHVKSIFYTLQGEGHHAGRPAVFLRFSRCNLWTGREKHRARAVCQFCDTDFVGTDGPGGGRYASASDLAEAVRSHWPPGPKRSRRFVVCTGGEPLLQLDEGLCEALHDLSFTIAVETNGTVRPPIGVDWLCVSPKAGAPLVLDEAHELKLVFPQAGLRPSELEDFHALDFRIQPMDGPDVEYNTRLAVQFCLANPQWRLSLQTHKILGIE